MIDAGDQPQILEHLCKSLVVTIYDTRQASMLHPPTCLAVGTQC